MFDLYRHIEELAKSHGLKNVTELCKKSGVPRTLMSELNNGRSQSISVRTAEKFAAVIGVSPDEVLGTSRELSDQDLKFALFGGDATDEQLEEVKHFAKFIISK